MAELDKPANIKGCAERLCDLGYWPVPIPAGCKGPIIDGWDRLRLTAETVPEYFTDSGMLVGVLHKNVLAFDIDVYDADLSARIVEEAIRRFPGALERIGEAPKSAIFLRMEGAGFKVRGSRKYSKGGVTAQLDVRSVTRQIVVYGKHPATGRPYRWPRGELWATPWSALPEAKREDVEAFRDWAEDLIRRWAGVADAKVIDIGLYSAHPGIATGEKPTPEAFREALRHIPATIGYDEWLECLMGIHDFYSGSGDGYNVACDWSSTYAAFSAHEVAQKWRSFEPGKGVSFRTVLHKAKQYGADLRNILRNEPYASTAFRIDTGADDEPGDEEKAESAAEEQPEPEPSSLEWFDDVQPALSDSYLVKGVLGAGAMSVVYGPSNSGKTFLALDIAFHVAIAAPWHGHRVNRGAVLYLAAEGGRGIANRIVALKAETGCCDVPLALRRAGLDLLKSSADLQHVADLAAEVRSKHPDLPLLMVVDTLSRVMAGGDENSPADMTALIRNIDAIRAHTGAHVMIVHHSGKDTARGARGHSSLRAATDTEIEVANEDGARAAMVTKQRDYEGGQVFAFGLKSVHLGTDQDGDEVSSCVVEWQDAEEFKAAKKASKGRGKNQQIVMDAFDQMVAEGMARPNPGGVGMPDPGRFWCVETDELRRVAQGKMTGDRPSALFRQAWDALTARDGLFVTGQNLCWRIDRRKQ